MNPVVGIRNNATNSFLIQSNIQEVNSMIPKTLFDVKYENLKDTFIIEIKLPRLVEAVDF